MTGAHELMVVERLRDATMEPGAVLSEARPEAACVTGAHCCAGGRKGSPTRSFPATSPCETRGSL